MAGDDLTQFEQWFGAIVAGLEPGQRRAATLKLGQALRRSNLARITANVDPDGASFDPRKPRKDRHGRLHRSAGKMFKGLRLSRNWRIVTDADGVEIAPLNGAVERVASISQFGEVATIGRLRDGRVIRARYAERRLLGFAPEDRQLAVDIAAELLDPGSS